MGNHCIIRHLRAPFCSLMLPYVWHDPATLPHILVANERLPDPATPRLAPPRKVSLADRPNRILYE